MLDEYVAGDASRISPEAPVPVIHHSQTKQVLGGVGNVAANLAALGCKTSVFYAVGPDSDAEHIEAMLKEKNVTPYPHAVASLTTKKQRVIAQKQQVCRIDFEEKLHLKRQQEEKIIHQILSVLPQFNIVILSDYDKGLLSPYMTQRIIRAAKQYNIPVLVDPKGHNYQKYLGATMIKPNQHEFKTAIHDLMPENTSTEGLDASTTEGMKKIQILAQRMRHTLNLDQLIVTLGENGMLGVEPTQSIHQPTIKHDVSDVSGAGDTSLAVLAAAQGAQASLQDALELANLGAGIVVAKEGTAILTSSELKKSLSDITSKNTKQTDKAHKIIFPCGRID